MAMGDHFTSRAAGAPAGFSSAAGGAAGERTANSAMIEVTTRESNDLVLIFTYLPDVCCFGRGGLAFERNSLRKLEKPRKYRPPIVVRALACIWGRLKPAPQFMDRGHGKKHF